MYIGPILEHIPFQHPCKSLYINVHPNKRELDKLVFLFCLSNIVFTGTYNARQNLNGYSPEHFKVQTVPFDRELKISVNAMFD